MLIIRFISVLLQNMVVSRLKSLTTVTEFLLLILRIYASNITPPRLKSLMIYLRCRLLASEVKH